MVLADSSVWVGHFRAQDPRLIPLLEEGSVLMHPFVMGEIACGHFKNRARVLAQLDALPVAATASHDEVMQFVEVWKLAGRGIGWIDTHLILSALLSDCTLWTLDVRLKNAAIHVGVRHYAPILVN